MKQQPDKPAFDFQAVFETDDYLYFYGELLTEERTQKELEFLVKELELNQPTRILDLACGHGRHANRLAERGHQVTGLDLTPGFLTIAKKDAAERKVNVEYVQGDMRQLSYREEFDRVLLLFTSFGYFEDEENFEVLKRVARALRPGGLLCLDIINRDAFLKNFLPFIVTEKGNDLMIERNSFDSATGRSYNRRIVIRDGKRKDKPFFVRLYNLNEIKELLSRVGLGVLRLFGDWESTPFSSESRRMIIIARKG